ncbi:unnamed protein product [Coregonus sp. 'balchen']|nr:unnamed protein product [Coregonus sp. 'balchen']
MDDLDAARGLSPWPTPPHEDSVSLSTSSTDTINLEDGHYSALRAELAADAQDLEGESWSVAVDQQYVNSLHQDAVKRQDVIYEVHHVRTLKLLLSVYQYELRQSLQMEETRLERMFPQFSGEMGERMKESYGVFCSHHTDAVSFYKEQLQNNKKFQNLMTKIGRLSVVRRLGVPECILLVTQRITKYPVLVERILLNTVADSEEHSALAQALVLIRETISAVDSQVHDYERASRLRDIGSRLEPRSQGRWKDGRVFTRDDLAEGSRTLLHEGTVSCRAANGRLKDIHAVLLSDVLLLLQKEKDQKLIFVNVDNKPSVISLQMLIVREMAHEDKAMFLISASSSKPEMYEIHTSSREDCNAWMSLIRDAVDSCPAMEEQLNSEQEEARLARLRDFRERLYMKDAQIVQSLTEKLQMFADMAEAVTGLENVAAHSRLLLRTDASDIQQGETLLKGAVTEVENLQNLLLSGVTVRDPHPTPEDSLRPGGFSLRPEVLRLGQGGLGLGRLGNLVVLRRAETFGGYDCNPPTPIKYGSIPAGERPGSVEGRHQRSNSDPQLQDLDQSESLELSAIVSQQDSHIELQRASILERERPGRPRGNMLLDQEKQRNLEKQREEMADFHKLQTQHRQNQARWEKERERHRLQAEDLERLRESTRTVEKQKEHLNTQMKLKQNKTITNPGSFNFKTQQSFRGDPLLSQSFRGDLMGGLTTGREVIQTPKVHVRPSLSVPPRRESISPGPPKPEFPIHLISTTNQVVHKPGAVQQQIPTKLAALGNKGKEKSSKKRPHHQRTHSAGQNTHRAGNESRSLRGKKTVSPHRNYQSDCFFSPPEPLSNAKPTQTLLSSSSMRNTQSQAPPPEPPPPPPPFPKDITSKPTKEHVIYL